MAPAGELTVVLTGFMGAGKTTTGAVLARLLARPFVDADAELERAAGKSIPAIFAEDGEAVFRELEASMMLELLDRPDPIVVAAGGGALTQAAVRNALVRSARTVWLDVPFETAWSRVRSDEHERPLAVEERRFRELHAARRPTYAACANAIIDASGPQASIAGAIACGVWTIPGSARRVVEAIEPGREVAIVDRGVVAELPAIDGAITLPGGEQVKSVASLERLWQALAEREVDRAGRIVAIGGGAVTDVAGFAAATFRRGIPWLPVPSTLVGQVDAAIGGKTAIDVAAKNDVGAFWMPVGVACDPLLLATLPQREWAAGFAEVVKTALLAGGALWELVRRWEPGPGELVARTELVQRCAGFKAAVVAEDPTELGRRAILNLGHTIGHGIETAAAGALRHGEAISVGLLAALRLSVEHRGADAGLVDEVEALLRANGLPVRAPVPAAAVMAAMRHDKKRVGDAHRFVLLDLPGEPRYGIELDEPTVERAVAGVVAP